MSFKFNSERDLAFKDYIPFIEGEMGKTEWVTVFEFFDKKYPSIDRGSYFSAFIPNKKRNQSLDQSSWDLLIGQGKPGFITSYINGEEKSEYFRFGDNSQIEPFVHWRSFKNRNTSVIDLSEEFRLYFDLFELIQSDCRTYIYTDENGEEEDVIKVFDNKVEVKLRFLKEYLAVREMSLAIYFDVMRFLPNSLEDLGIEHFDNIVKNEAFTYTVFTRNLNMGEMKSQGWILGKKLISGSKDFKFFFWRLKEDEKFEEFIVGVDEEGENILASSNTDYQSNPSFLTPVFFRREVLKKYYDSPDVFSVEDGYLRREGGFWGLRMMNNARNHVVVWLGDLKNLPFKEQNHWRAFNVTPEDRRIAHCDFTRNIEGEFCDSEHPELYFKYRYKVFQNAWNKKFGWYLFDPLHEGDQYHLKSLHIPTTEGEKEFEDQVLSISKILIDSLNQKELKKGIITDIESPGKIDYLDLFLKSQGYSSDQMIDFLRKLQALRSSAVAHRKGSKIQSSYKYFNLDSRSTIEVFEDIIIKSIWILNSLNTKFQLKLDES